MFKEHLVFNLVPIASTPISSPVVDLHPVATTYDEPIEDVGPVGPNVNLVASDVVIDIPLRRSERARRSEMARKPAISYDYIVCLQEH